MEIYGICTYRKKLDNCKYLISDYTCIIHDLGEIYFEFLLLHDTIFTLNNLYVKMSIYLIFIYKMRYIHIYITLKSAFDSQFLLINHEQKIICFDNICFLLRILLLKKIYIASSIIL